MPRQVQVVWEGVTPRQACIFLGISRSTLNRMVDRGDLTPWRLPSGHRRFRAQELRRIRRARRRQTRVKPGQTGSRGRSASK